MKIRQQFSYFADVSRISATPEETMRIFSELAKEKIMLLPGTFQEIVPPSIAPSLRIKFSAPDGGKEVLIATQRVDIIEQYPSFDEGPGASDFKDFADFVGICLSSVLGDKPLNASRIALITQFVLSEKNEEQLRGIYGRLIGNLGMYTQETCFEWTVRTNHLANISFSGVTESVNCILKADRMQGQFLIPQKGSQGFDRVIYEVDVNTSTANLAQRFRLTDTPDFIKEAATLTASVSQSLLERVRTSTQP